ncbi:MAG: chloride channel protein [Lachnospiraceae bacterium]|jgi:H+/Cl- antiporter ClcA|nr:chloride channel protein [Lachnospiraceae bacterium]MCI1397135.1 chloride channel protein [Lachnospiraceae bacterium]MCI1422961.1 chloride channel protein [Lachnospiraceae bacterium]MCI1451696.1 chloride channel protein [Lachnospiraceae bacterium]
MISKGQLKQRLATTGSRWWFVLRWVAFALVCGVVLGLVGGAFAKLIDLAGDVRTAHPAFLLLLPVGALLIHGFYKAIRADDTGTNLILSSVQSGQAVPLRLAPAIFFSTVFSHLCGASVGREGAALQLGGSVSSALGKIFHLHRDDHHVMVMCGMSAAFSAIFATPMSAAVFSMEVVNVGIMHYAALLPCIVSSLTARAVARAVFDLPDARYAVTSIPTLSFGTAVEAGVFGLACGFVCILYCSCLHHAETGFQKRIKSPALRAVILGALLLGMTYLSGGQTFNGTGSSVIGDAIFGVSLPWYYLLVKILFTSLSLAAGYKGGEIVPALFVGSCLGNLTGAFFPACGRSLLAACGIGAAFCGVTNSPITALLICLDLFGMDGAPYYLLAVAVSYLASGYYGLYNTQKIAWPKYRAGFPESGEKN